MKYLMVLDIGPDDQFPEDKEAAVPMHDRYDLEDALLSVDMEGSIREGIADYLMVLPSDVDVSIGDVTEVRPPKDRRRLRRFVMRSNGTIDQEGAV